MRLPGVVISMLIAAGVCAVLWLFDRPASSGLDDPLAGAPQERVVEEVHGAGTLRITYVWIDDQWVRKSEQPDSVPAGARRREMLPDCHWLIYVGWALSLIGWIAISAIGFTVSWWWGLACLFVPFANVLFVWSYWPETGKWFVLCLCGWVLIRIGIMADW